MSAAAAAAALAGSVAAGVVPSTAARVGSVLATTSLNAASLGPVSGQLAGDTLIGLWLRTNTTNPGIDASNAHLDESPVTSLAGARIAFTAKVAAADAETSGATTNSVSRAALVGVRNSPAHAAEGVYASEGEQGTGTTVTIPVPAAAIPPEGVRVIVLVAVNTADIDLSAGAGISGLSSVAADGASDFYWHIFESAAAVTAFAGGTFSIASSGWAALTLYVR